MLHIVRHGRTAANAARLLLGRADPPLDDLGRRQALALARRLEPSLVVSSPLRRAQATATAFGLPVRTDDRWIELDYGELDERPLHEVPPDVWRRWRDDPEWAPPGGESLAALGRRVAAACDDLHEEATAGDVVVVTHVSPVKAAVAWALEVGVGIAWRMHVSEASVTAIDLRPSGPVVTAFNDVGHLGAGVDELDDADR